MQRRKEERQRRAEKRDRYKQFYCHRVRLLTVFNVLYTSLWLLYASRSLQCLRKALQCRVHGSFQLCCLPLACHGLLIIASQVLCCTTWGDPCGVNEAEQPFVCICRVNSKQVDEESHNDPDDPNNHLVFNYSYYDSARRDHLHGPAQSQKKLGS